MDPDLLERWLAARDHVAIREAWSVLPVVRRPLGSNHRKLTLHGAAQLAGAMLGERADWLVERSLGAPTFTVNRISDGSFLDHVWSIHEANNETLTIHEQRDGARGVQRISISSGTITGRPEGGGVTVVRLFDLDRDHAVVVPIEVYSVPEVATIGEIDLSPLDLLEVSRPFTLGVGERDVATARALVAQLVAEVDAHFDTSTLWAAGEPPGPTDWYLPDITSQQSFIDGSRGVSIGHDQRGRIHAHVHGLAWGQRFMFQLEAGGYHYLVMRFSGAELDRICARLAALGSMQ